MRDVSHVPIAPYVAAAVVGLAHHASAATFSAELLAKMWPNCSRRAGLVALGKARVERLIGTPQNA